MQEKNVAGVIFFRPATHIEAGFTANHASNPRPTETRRRSRRQISLLAASLPLGFRLTHPTPRSSGPGLPPLETRTKDPGRQLASMKGPTGEERCPGFRIQPSDPSEFLIPPYAFAGYPPNTALRSTEHSTGLPDCPENGVFSCSVSGRMISFVLKLWVQSLRDANTS